MRCLGSLALSAALVPPCAGCRRDTEVVTVTVFAAASLAQSMRALERAYEADHPRVDIVPSFAGSQVLAAQIIEGAPADMFASANLTQLDRVARENDVESRRVFATNDLVVIVASDSSIRGVEDLVNPGVRVVMGVPEAPVGRYAREALAAIGLLTEVEARVVSNELDVRGVVAKVRLGEADAGLGYATDVRNDRELTAIPLPPGARGVAAHYELALIARSRAEGDTPAREFAEFITSPRGLAILADHGFGPPT